MQIEAEASACELLTRCLFHLRRWDADEMSTKLVETYRRVRHSIVAFVPHFATSPDEARGFPPILGSGVIVHEDGLVATNDHVVEALMRLPRPKDFDKIPAGAMLLILTKSGIVQLFAEVYAVYQITKLAHGAAYYGPKTPDLAFVQIKVRGVLPASIRAVGHVYEEGQDVATAGFPMGTDKLAAPGWIHQLSPTLQTTIISAVHPFPCATPHGFTINAMVQGGASGSPVFCPDTGDILGVVYAGLSEVEERHSGLTQRIPTNFTFAVASHFIANTISGIVAREEFQMGVMHSKPVEQMFDEYQMINVFTGEDIAKPTVPW